MNIYDTFFYEIEDEPYPLHLAAFFGNVEYIKRLLKEGADINQFDSEGLTPLLTAIKSLRGNNRIETVKILIKYGADVNLEDVDGWVPLHFAVHFDSPYLWNSLLKKIDNKVIVESAHRYMRYYNITIHTDDSINIFTILINNGANVNHIDNRFGRNPLKYALNSCKTINLPILLAAGADHPNDLDITCLKKEIELAGFNAIRKRAGTICIAMQTLNLPAPQMIEVILQTCVPFAENLPYHYLWDLVVTVKHFHDRQQAKKQLLKE
jgi:hypothetical protein